MALQPNDTETWFSIFRQHLDEMFSYIFDMRTQGGGYFEFAPQLDIYETADLYVLEIDLPGFLEGDFSVSVATDANIRIEGIKRQEKTDGSTSYFCLERHFGRFSRTLAIPPAFDLNGLCKKYERGVLTVTFPRIKGAIDGY
jgi:HSP20 family protein